MNDIVLGVQENLCFFTIHCNPSIAYIAVKDLQCSQRNASVQSRVIVQPMPNAGEGGVEFFQLKFQVLTEEIGKKLLKKCFLE